MKILRLFYTSGSKFLCAWLIVFICLLLSCDNNKKQADQPVSFYNNILDSVSTEFGFTQKSFHFVDSVFSNYNNEDFETRFKYLTYLCGYYHIARNDERKAMCYADTMLMLVKNRPDSNDYKKEEALANISKGDILFAQKKYNDAYFYYYLGKVAAQKSLDACTYSEYSYRLAMVMYKTSNYQSAATYFRQAFTEGASCKEDFNNFYRMQEILNNTALSYCKNGDNDSSLLYYKKTLTYIDEKEPLYPAKKDFFSTARGVIYGNTAQLYTAKDFKKAEALFKQSIAINSRPNHDINDALVTQLHLAFLYHDNKKREALDKLLKEIKTGLDTIKNNNQAQTDFNELMWKVSEEKNQIPVAYRYLLAYNKLKKEEAENNNKLSKTDIANEIKNLESDYNVKLLKKDNKLHNVYSTIASVLFLLSAISIILIWNYWTRSKRNVRDLTLMNTQVQFQKEELQSAFRQLEIRDSEKDRIFQILAHDLKNPIAGIHSLVSILSEEYHESEPLLQMFELIRNGCNNSLELINEILECTAYEQQSAKSTEQVVDVNRIVNSCCRLLRFKASEKKQVLQVKLNQTPQYIKVHPSRLFRVLNNLITNAVKFSPKKTKILAEVVDAGDHVNIIIRDEGIGVPEAFYDKLFESHDYIKRDGTAGEKSYGMGLAICKQIMDSYNGKIWFETTEGKGTSFYISFLKETDNLPFLYEPEAEPAVELK